MPVLATPLKSYPPSARWRRVMAWMRLRVEPDYEAERRKLQEARARYDAMVKEINADLPPRLRRGT